MKFSFTKTYREWPAGNLLYSIFVLTRRWLSTKLSSSSLYHLSHFSDLDCFSLWKSSLPRAGWGGRVWCLWCWAKQTAGFSHRVMKTVCLCSQQCVCACVCVWASGLFGRVSLVNFPLRGLGHIHSKSAARPYDLFRGAGDELPLLWQPQPWFKWQMSLLVRTVSWKLAAIIKMNAFDRDNNLPFCIVL